MSELDALADAAWQADPAEGKELWKRARKLPPMVRSAVTVDWVRKKGYERDHRHDRNALEWAAFALAVHGDPRVVPFLVSRAFERWDFGRLLLPWLDTDRVDRTRVASAVRPLLRGEDTGSYDWELAAQCLARCGNAEDAEAIASRLSTCFDAIWTTNAGLAVRSEDTSAALGEAMLALSIPKSLVPMLEAVVGSEQSGAMDRARGTAALLLASAGEGLEAIVRAIRSQVERAGPSDVQAGQLLALGALAKAQLVDDARRGLCDLVEKILSTCKEPDVCVAGEAALTDLGRPRDLTAAVSKCLAATSYSWGDTVKRWVFALDLVGARADLPVELATDFVLEDDPRLHRAAVRALRARGVPVPRIHVLDRYALETSSVEALCDALGDAHTLAKSEIAKQLVVALETAGESQASGTAGRLIPLIERLPPVRHDEDHRRETRRNLVRALLRTKTAEACAVAARAIEADGKLVDIDELPPALAPIVVKRFVRAEDKRTREDARSWISARTAEAAVTRELGRWGLSIEDFPRRAT